MWLTMTPIRLATPRNAMNPNGAPMIHSADQRADDAERNRREHDQRLDRVAELEHQRQEDGADRDQHHHRQVR